MTTSEKLFTPIDVVSKVIKIDVKCTELKGGLLDAKNGPPYTLYHDDGTNLTQCHPVKNGVPQVSWDPAWGAESFKAKPPSQYSGLMRQVVQCMYLRNDTSNYSPTFYLTHGIFKGAVVPAVPPETDDTHPYWVVEISHKGVFAKRLPFLDKRESKDEHDLDAFVAKKCWSTTTPPAEDPAIKYNGTMGTYDISKKCCSVGRVREVVYSYDGYVLIWPEWESQLSILGANPLTVIDPLDRIHKLIDAADMTEVTTDYFPFADNIGWAFSYSGHEAQVVVWKLFNDADATQGYVTARWKISISETTQNVAYRTSGGAISIHSEQTLTGSLAKVEEQRFFPFSEPRSLLWYPYSGAYQWFKPPIGTPPSVQNAPIHVWYVGSTEKVIRYEAISDIVPTTMLFDLYGDSPYDQCDVNPFTGMGNCNSPTGNPNNVGDCIGTASTSSPRTGERSYVYRDAPVGMITAGFVFSGKTAKAHTNGSSVSELRYEYDGTVNSWCITDESPNNFGAQRDVGHFTYSGTHKNIGTYNYSDTYTDACVLLLSDRESAMFIEHRHEERQHTSNGGWSSNWFEWKAESHTVFTGCNSAVIETLGTCEQFCSVNSYPPPFASGSYLTNGTTTISGVINNAYVASGGGFESFLHNPGTGCSANIEMCSTRDGDYWYKFLVTPPPPDYTTVVKSDVKHAGSGKNFYLKQQDNQPYHDEEYVINGGFNTTYGDLFIGKI